MNSVLPITQNHFQPIIIKERLSRSLANNNLWISVLISASDLLNSLPKHFRGTDSFQLFRSTKYILINTGYTGESCACILYCNGYSSSFIHLVYYAHMQTPSLSYFYFYVCISCLCWKPTNHTLCCLLCSTCVSDTAKFGWLTYISAFIFS